LGVVISAGHGARRCTQRYARLHHRFVQRGIYVGFVDYAVERQQLGRTELELRWDNAFRRLLHRREYRRRPAHRALTTKAPSATTASHGTWVRGAGAGPRIPSRWMPQACPMSLPRPGDAGSADRHPRTRRWSVALVDDDGNVGVSRLPIGADNSCTSQYDAARGGQIRQTRPWSDDQAIDRQSERRAWWTSPWTRMGMLTAFHDRTEGDLARHDQPACRGEATSWGEPGRYGDAGRPGLRR
jgi:hypothetical protein